jgi:hypothetical protein
MSAWLWRGLRRPVNGRMMFSTRAGRPIDGFLNVDSMVARASSRALPSFAIVDSTLREGEQFMVITKKEKKEKKKKIVKKRIFFFFFLSHTKKKDG